MKEQNNWNDPQLSDGDFPQQNKTKFQVGEGDHSYTDVVILEEKQFINYIIAENKMRKKYAGQSKAEFFSTDDDDYISPDASESVDQIDE